MTRRNGQHADFAFAELKAIGRRLDPVINGIADDVSNRIADGLDHFAIEFDVAPLQIDHNLFAKIG